jgi:hypothetical protein
VLQSLYTQVLVPFEVCQEIMAGGSSGFAVAEFEAATWRQKQQTCLTISPLLLNLTFDRDLENLSPNLSPARREALNSPPSVQ